MKQPIANILIFLLMLLFSMPGQALNNYYFNIISRDKGLSQTNVKAIIQDSDGFMWFGTRNKLNRYDGNTFKVFDCYDHVAQKRNNNISSLFEDQEKQLWIGTDNGVFKLNPKTEEFTYMDIQTAEGITMTDWISDIKEDKDGNLSLIHI